jgi:hypothetical protein
LPFELTLPTIFCPADWIMPGDTIAGTFTDNLVPVRNELFKLEGAKHCIDARVAMVPIIQFF